MLATIDIIKQKATLELDQNKRSSLGQFMTPASVAKFIASMFKKSTNSDIRLLDAGAGIGTLSASFIERFSKIKTTHNISVTAYEIEPVLIPYFSRNMEKYKAFAATKDIHLHVNLIPKDFIAELAQAGRGNFENIYSHAILNPPYKKINSSSLHRSQLRSLGIETVNLYSAFVALSLMALEEKGELVAIIPRSFCNGNYYKSFREFIVDNASIDHIHLFESRNQAFKEDDVLQENVIIKLTKGGRQNEVIISKSNDDSFDDMVESRYSFKHIVKPEDRERFIHVPSNGKNHLQDSTKVIYSLKDLALQVSTGPVVDFRAKEHISQTPRKGFIPLLYPTHFNGKEIEWPKNGKKPNAIAFNLNTKKMLYPRGFYTVVKRFSSKEEKQRIVARVINPRKLDFDYIGIENHLNVFHSGKMGISENLAFGLAAYLNSSFVDIHFRSFNGHTQVNAMDLKQMKYPSLAVLSELGKWAKKLKSFDQDKIDVIIKEIL